MAHFPPLADYYVVQDSSPGAQVWSTVAGAFVADSDATFEAWLPTVANSPVEGGTTYEILSCASASGGAATSLQISDTTPLTSGQTWNVSNTGLYDGNQTITVLDATHVTIPAAFAGNATGFLGGAAFIDTIAHLLTNIDGYNRTLWQAGKFLGVNTSSVPASGTTQTIVLANPVVGVQVANFSGGGSGSSPIVLLQMPHMGVPGALPIGATVVIINKLNDNAGHQSQLVVMAQDGVMAIASVAIPPQFNNPYSNSILLELISNSTPNGTWAVQQINQIPLATRNGGLNTTTSPTSAQIPIGNAGGTAYVPQTISGDITISNAGAAALQNIPTDTPMAGDLLATNVATPAIPASGKTRVFVNSTSKNLFVINDAGTINHGVQTKTAASHKWIASIADDGSSAQTQPATTDLSDVTAGGSWTPSDQSGAGLTFSSVSVQYDQIGNRVFVSGELVYPTTASGSAAKIGGLPVAVPNQNYCDLSPSSCLLSAFAGVSACLLIKGTSNFEFLSPGAGALVTNAQLSGATVRFTFSYPAT